MDNYYAASYPESGDSSPRSREVDFDNPPPWDDNHQPPPNYRVKFMCSYGGKIHPRPNDNQLSYLGGDTKILAVDRTIKFASLLSKLIALCEGDTTISFKYQLPGEDLDALISVTNDDDLEHMMHEYERLCRSSPKPARLRIFVFSNQSLNSSTRSFDSDEAKSEKDRFVEALNSAPIMQPAAPPAQRGQPPDSGNVDFLFGLEKANPTMAANAPVQAPPMAARVPEMEDQVSSDERFMAMDPIQKHIQDLQRLRLEEQQAGFYRRKSIEENTTPGEYYRLPEKISPSAPAAAAGVPYWTDTNKQVQVQAGVYPTSTISNEQPVYMIQAPANAYHAPMVRQMAAGAPTAQGYYTVQRIPSDVYRDHQQQQQQQQMFNMIPQGAQPTLPQQNRAAPAVYSDGFGMVRPASTGGMGMGMMTETGYAQMAYDNGMGRQVVYAAGAGAQYQHPQAAAMGGAGGAGVMSQQEGPGGAGGKPRVTQSSV